MTDAAGDPSLRQEPGPGPPGVNRRGLWGKLRAYFITGVLITTPVVFSIYIALLVIDFFDTRAARLIPPQYNPAHYLPVSVPGLSLLVFVVLLTLVGVLTTGYVGRLVTRLFDNVMAHVPVFRAFYAGAKQVLLTVLSPSATAFRQVVLLQYPRPGLWVVGFVTGSAKTVFEEREEELVTLLMPPTPLPHGGWMLLLPRRDLIYLDISVEDAVKLVFSGGILTPDMLRVKRT